MRILSASFFILILLSISSCKPEQASQFSVDASGDYYPPFGKKLNHTIIMFEFPAVFGADNYIVEIVPFIQCPSFEECIIQTLETSGLAVQTNEKLEFGKNYKWRVRAQTKGKDISVSEELLFETTTHKKLNSSEFRNRIVKTTPNVLDGGYIFVDAYGVLIDELGEPVWYTPLIAGSNGKANGRVLKNGNIAYLPDRFIEIDLNSNNDKLYVDIPFTLEDGTECLSIHHDFAILPNGNYLTLGLKSVPKKAKKGDLIASAGYEAVSDMEELGAAYGLVIEIDKKTGEVVWSYDIADYIDQQNTIGSHDMIGNGHMNSVYYDETEDMMYVSLRDFSRVIKIDRTSKKVLEGYGPDIGIGKPDKLAPYFNKQHSAQLDEDGNLLLYNNNTGKGGDTISSVVLLKSAGEKMEKIWEFECDFGDKSQSWSRAKGDVDILPNGNYLIGMGTIARTLIVNKNKEILWQCEHEQYMRPISRPGRKVKDKGIKWRHTGYNYSVSWNKTLYPNYYTAQIIEEGQGISLRIDNCGDLENDLIWKITKDGEIVEENHAVIKNGTHINIPLPGTAIGKYEVVLSSAYDSRTKKVYLYNVKAN